MSTYFLSNMRNFDISFTNFCDTQRRNFHKADFRSTFLFQTHTLSELVKEFSFSASLRLRIVIVDFRSVLCCLTDSRIPKRFRKDQNFVENVIAFWGSIKPQGGKKRRNSIKNLHRNIKFYFYIFLFCFCIRFGKL